jgi:hypothetical protein
MKSVFTCFWIMICSGTAIQGQITPEISTRLQSADWGERQRAYEELTGGQPRSAAGDDALVALLLREDSIIRTDFKDRPIGYGDGEGWGEYVSKLSESVQEIAEKQPENRDAWRALVWTGYDGGSKFGRWLAGHGDKVAPLLLAEADKVSDAGAGHWQKFPGGQAIVTLAQVVAYEEDPASSHHLNGAYLSGIESTIRRALASEDDGVRYQAIKALASIGTSDDAAILDRVALTDPGVNKDAGASGKETRYFNREAARAAAEQIRKRLAASADGKIRD